MKGASTIFLQYFPLNMSIVWNNNIGEIGAKRNEYEGAAPQARKTFKSACQREFSRKSAFEFLAVRQPYKSLFPPQKPTHTP